VFCSVAISVLNSSMGSLEEPECRHPHVAPRRPSARRPLSPVGNGAAIVLRDRGAFVVEALGQSLVVRAGLLAVNVDLPAQQLAGFQQPVGLQVLRMLPDPSGQRWRAGEHGGRRMAADARPAARTWMYSDKPQSSISLRMWMRNASSLPGPKEITPLMNDMQAI